MRKEVNRLDVFVFVVRLATAVVGLLREAIAFSETLRRGRNRKDRQFALAVPTKRRCRLHPPQAGPLVLF